MEIDFQKIINVAGFYGTKKEIQLTLKKWIGADVYFNKQKKGHCSIYFCKTNENIAIVLLVDDDIYKQPFDQNCPIILFIKIMQDMVKTIYLCFQDSSKMPKKSSELPIKKKLEIKDTLENFLDKFQKQFEISYQKIKIDKEYKFIDKHIKMKNLVISKEFQEDLRDFYFCNNNILFIKAINLYGNYQKQIIYLKDLQKESVFDQKIFQNSKKEYMDVIEYLDYISKSIGILYKQKTIDQIIQQIYQEIKIFLQKSLTKDKMQKIVGEILIIIKKSKKLSKQQKLKHFTSSLREMEKKYDTQLWQLQNRLNIQIRLYKADILRDNQKDFLLQQKQIDTFQLQITKKSRKNVNIQKFLQYSDNVCFLVLFCESQKTSIIYKIVIHQNKKIFVEHFQDFNANILICFNQKNKNLFVLDQCTHEILVYEIEDNGQINQVEDTYIFNNKKIVDFKYLHKFKEFLFLLEDNKIYKISKNDLFAFSKDQDKKLQELLLQKTKYENFIHLSFQGYFCLKHKDGIELYDDDQNIIKTFDSNLSFQKAQFFCNNKKLYFVAQSEQKLYLNFLKELQIQIHEISKPQSSMRNFVIIDYFASGVILYGSGKNFQNEKQKKLILVCDDNCTPNMQQYIKDNNYDQYFKMDIQSETQKQTKIFSKLQKDFDYDFMLKYRLPIWISVLEKESIQLLYNQKNQQDSIFRSQTFMFENNPIINISLQKQISDILDYINFGMYENISQNTPIITILNIQDPFVKQPFQISNYIFGTLFQTVFSNQQQGLQLSVCKKENVTYVLLNCDIYQKKQYLSQKGLHLLFRLIQLCDITLYDCEQYQSECSKSIFSLLTKFFSRGFEEQKVPKTLYIFSRDVQNTKQTNQQQNIYNSEELRNIFKEIGIKFFSQTSFDVCLKYFTKEIEYLVQQILGTDNQKIKEKQQKIQHTANEPQMQQEISKILSQTKSFCGQHGKGFKEDLYETKLPARSYKSSFSKKDLQKQYQKYQTEEKYEALKEMQNVTQEIQNKSQIQGNVFIDLFQFQNKLKIGLAQVTLGDDSNINTLVTNVEIQNVYNQSIEFFQQFNDSFAKTITYVYLHDNSKKKTLQIDQKKITFYKQDIDFKSPFEDKNHYLNQNLYKQFLKIFNTKIQYSIEKHDKWIEAFYDFCHKVVNQRIQSCVEYFKNNFSLEKDMKDQIEKMSLQLQKKLSQVLMFYKKCNYKNSEQCQQCSRKCAMSMNHVGLCNCYTEHNCMINCNKKNCLCKNQTPCQEKYGHSGNDHGCPNQQSRCKSLCLIYQCQRQCGKDGLTLHYIHNCLMNHQCQQKCHLSQCNETCVKFIEEIHGINNDDVQSQNDNYSYHDCGSEHECQQKCEHDDFCEVIYQPRQDVQAFDQILLKNKCAKMIPPYNLNHTGQHVCSSIHIKRCQAKCPQCQIMCSKHHGHEGLHFHLEHQQRNDFILSTKDQQMFLNVKSNYGILLTIINQSPKKSCIGNCKRMRINDIHLVECSQLDSCYVEQLDQSQARHPEKQEEPPVDIIKCPYFFELYGWEKPLPISNKNNLQLSTLYIQ